LHIKSIRIRNFKRFTDLVISDVAPTARLVVVTGANGSGKSAVLEALNVARRQHTFNYFDDESYYGKIDSEGVPATDRTTDVEFHEGAITFEEWKKAIWVRSAFRHQPDFYASGITQLGSPLDSPGVERLIAGEQLAQENFMRLTSASVESLYNSANRGVTAGVLIERIIGPLQRALRTVFDDLQLENLTDPLSQGTFYFSKGSSTGFAFKNLSAGEQAAFDLLLDMVIRVKVFDNTVFCIDEPELHLGTRAQARLLDALLDLLPPDCQLWVATHSPGMMRAALRLYETRPTDIAFLDTFGHDFDSAVVMRPVIPSRDFWRRSLETALDDLAKLVAPSTLVLCEGNAVDGFDAVCYRNIFGATHPDVEFISVGNSIEVRRDSQGVAAAIQVIAPGTRVISLTDRDDATNAEIVALQKKGMRVLSARNIEGYLLANDVIVALYEQHGRGLADAAKAIQKREQLLVEAAGRGSAADDYKKVAPNMRSFLKADLTMSQIGSDVPNFLIETMSSLIAPGSTTFERLRKDIFGTV
jgi:predicted ATPase